MGVNPLEGIFAAKSFWEHIQGVADGDPQAMTGLGADILGAAQTLPKYPPSWQTPIISAGLMSLNVMQLTCGSGTADPGDRFGAGASRFSGIGATLESAFPSG